MKNIIFNPFFPNYKTPVGAVKNSDNILITIYIVDSYHLYQLQLIVRNDANQEVLRKTLKLIKTENGYHQYEINFSLSEIGLYWYFFELSDTYGTHFIGANRDLDGVLTDYYPTSWQLLIHQEYKGQLSWFKGKIMYQIMVDRFYKQNNLPIKPNAVMHEDWLECPHYQPQNGKILNHDFFGGNLQGIIAKLDYLKSLHVGIIYLNPIFESPSNHKYDTSNYQQIDSMFGTEEDFVLLCQLAKEKEISIIFDGVYNHTGDDSVYFNKYHHFSELGAYQSRSSKYYSWYKFKKWPDDYACWWGFKTLPAVNQDDSNYLNFITGRYGVLDKWLSKGAKGVRLDVVDELNDHFLDKIYARVKENNSENLVLGEVWEDASTKMAYDKRRKYLWGSQLDSVMNYPLKNAIIDFLQHDNLTGLVMQMRHLVNNYPKHVLDNLMNHLGTHDTIRLLTNFVASNGESLTKEEQANYRMNESEMKNAIVKLKMATAMQFTLPGVPSIYYGDETGMEGFRDPFCRRTIDWEHINEEIFSWYQKLGQIRTHSVYISGVYSEESTGNNVFAFSRENNEEKIMTIINNNNHEIHYHLNSGFDLLQEERVFKKVIIPKKSVKFIQIK